MHFFQKGVNYIFHRFKKRDTQLFKKILADSKMPVEKQREAQLERLNKLLVHAYQKVPYYKGAFSDKVFNIKEPLKKIDDLSSFPILTKEDIRKAGKEMYSLNHEGRGTYSNTSGGSSGAPIKVIQDLFYAQEASAMFLFVKTMRSVNPYSSTVVLWGAARDLYGGKNTFKGYILDFVTNTKSFNAAKMTNNDIEAFISYVNHKKPSLILAYAQSIYQVALYAHEQKVKVIPQNAIHSGAGQMFPFMREIVESVFQCKVFDHYGGREFGALASECKEGKGLHVLGYNRIVEILDSDGKPCKAGEEGEIVATVLDNFSMPLIRYKVGDRGIWSNQQECSCGNNYPKVARITGRTSNNFPLKDGGVVSGEYLTLTYNNIPGVINFQLRQKNFEEIVISLITDRNYEPKTEQIIRTNMEKLFGENLQLYFNYVDDISTTPTGKHLFTISDIKQ